MVVKHVRDQEGRTYAIPDHILEDFEISAAEWSDCGEVARWIDTGNSHDAHSRRRVSAVVGSAWEAMTTHSIRAISSARSRPRDLLSSPVPRSSIRVNTTLGQLASALQLHKTLGRPGAGSGRSGTSSVAAPADRWWAVRAMGGYDDGFTAGSMTWTKSCRCLAIPLWVIFPSRLPLPALRSVDVATSESIAGLCPGRLWHEICRCRRCGARAMTTRFSSSVLDAAGRTAWDRWLPPAAPLSLWSSRHAIGLGCWNCASRSRATQDYPRGSVAGNRSGGR